MANHNLPTLTSTYTNFITELDGRLDDISIGFDPALTTATNLVTGAIRWSSASSKWEKWSGTAWGNLATNYAISISGNANTVTNGVYTTGSYADPAWITSIAGSKISGNISGNAGSVSNGVYTTGSYADPAWITSIAGSKISGNISGNAGSVSNGVYTTGSYADPAWITSLAGSKVSGNISGSAGSVATAVTFNSSGNGSTSGTTFNGSTAITVSYNTIGAPSASGAGASGSWNINAATVTNGVYTTGDQTIAGVKTFSSKIVGKTGGADTVPSISIATTGGSYASMYATRRGTPYQVSVNHTGSSYAPAFGIQYEYTGLYTGLYSFGHLATGVGNPGSFAIHHINSGNTEDRAWTFAGVTGDFTSPGNVTAYSDEKLKTEWNSLPSDFLQLLANVKNGTYTRVDTKIRQVGVSAQSLKTAMPEAVIDGETLSVAYGNAALAAAVELAKEVCEHKTEINMLKEQLNILNSKLSELIAAKSSI